MKLKILYGAVAALVVLVAVQMWSDHRVFRTLDRDFGVLVYGAPADRAAVTVHGFVDYTCRLCKEVDSFILHAVVDVKDARIVLHPLPQQDTGPSQRAARVALATARLGGGVALHDSLMRNEMPLDDETIRTLADRVFLDADRILAEENSDEITAHLERTRDIAARMGVTDLPTFFIGRKYVYTPANPAMAYPEFIQLLRQAR